MGEPGECLEDDGTKGGGFTGTGGAGSNNAGNCSGTGCQGNPGGEPSDPANPEEELKTDNPAVDSWPLTVSPYGSPCEMLLPASSCGNISKLIGITVLIIDMTALGLSMTGFIMELVGTGMGGPGGLAAAIAEYAATLNPIENTLGSTALALNALNDFLITGESFIDTTKTYQGTPGVDLVLGSDTSVGLVTTLLGSLSPEGLSDSIINTGVVVYDVHRLTGGQGLVQTHIILTANGNLHLGFGFPQ